MQHQLFWNDYLGCYDALNELDAYQEYLKELTIVADSKPGRLILDAGSGTGNLSIMLKEMGADVISLDFSRTGLEKHLEKDPDAKQVYASLENKLPLASQMFDTIVCASVLFSLSPEGIECALSEFLRLLKPGGKLVLTVARHDISKLRMAYNHYRSQWISMNGVQFIKELFKSMMPTIKVLLYNFKMHSHNKDKSLFRRFTKEELTDSMVANRFSVLRYGITMGGGFQLLVAQPTQRPYEIDKNILNGDVQ